MTKFKSLSELKDICRTCMIKSDDLTSVFKEKWVNKEKVSLAKMIQTCTSVKVSIDNVLINRTKSKNSVDFVNTF